LQMQLDRHKSPRADLTKVLNEPLTTQMLYHFS
jgi:hypothetical protein